MADGGGIGGALSTAALGMSAQQQRVNNISNNLANVSTTAFKRSKIAFQDLLYETKTTSSKNKEAQLQIGHGSKAVGNIRYFSQGSMEQTGRGLDLAIKGTGFFRVQMHDGSIAYTRDGSLTVNSEGAIVTQSGLPLADDIYIPQDAVGIQINQQGVVSAKLPGDQGSIELGQLELVKFINPSGLSAMGDNLYARTEAAGLPQFGIAGMDGFGTVEQGFLEQSNVNIVTSMVSLIQAQRAYETNAKMIQTAEEMMQMTNSIKR